MQANAWTTSTRFQPSEVDEGVEADKELGRGRLGWVIEEEVYHLEEDAELGLFDVAGRNGVFEGGVGEGRGGDGVYGR